MLTLEKKLGSRSNQMIKSVHPDFSTVAEAMIYAFSTIEKNQAWDLMPSLVPELALCLHMLQRELRAGFAADLIVQDF